MTSAADWALLAVALAVTGVWVVKYARSTAASERASLWVANCVCLLSYPLVRVSEAPSVAGTPVAPALAGLSAVCVVVGAAGLVRWWRRSRRDSAA
ncbi:hypothetical protein [Candidatus Halobonum tyrrellensis]|uniref:Uncharacterized protein n=1 Tax=Candidatus Halobonum tyrrellensis G22 TaxID=1324957 RepID=V4IVH2_9EURY|nr:hypothetical protein [Candidatus Halobonum tyrrellensis]ESP87202.1 hypothetical protein K933_15094 [Candidatus Halobonum tyrrellensis G22]